MVGYKVTKVLGELVSQGCTEGFVSGVQGGHFVYEVQNRDGDSKSERWVHEFNIRMWLVTSKKVQRPL